MIKFLFDNFQNFPVIGTPIKIAYISHLVNGVINDGVRSSSAKDLKGLTGDELEAALNEEGGAIFDEHIAPHIKNVPQEALDAAKEKAVGQIVAKLREKADTKIDAKLGFDKEEEAATEEVKTENTTEVKNENPTTDIPTDNRRE